MMVRIASAGQDGFVKIWNGNSGEEMCKLGSWVEKCYNPHSNVLPAQLDANKLWTDQRSTFYESSEHSSTIADMSWNPDGSGIAVLLIMESCSFTKNKKNLENTNGKVRFVMA